MRPSDTYDARVGLGEKFGRWDDRSVIYRADDPEQRVAWGRLGLSVLATSAVVGLMIAVAGGVDLGDLASAVIFGGSVLFLIGYVIWRRRRNRGLTGSPTKWPTD